jgi:hypothetical protein
MAEISGRIAGPPSTWLRDGYMRAPVFYVWIALAGLFAVLAWAGFRLNGDFDDLLKLHEIEWLLESGNLFDRTLPGILQPEPFVTHWPVLVDLPYAALAALMAPVAGLPIALAIACLVGPLLLMAPALYFYHRVITATGFANPAIVLPLAAMFAFRSFAEFAPGRIDYHNLEILLLLASLALTLSRSRHAATANGAVTALALATSLEFALFFALTMGIHATEFAIAARDGARRIASFGVALAITGAALFLITTPAGNYWVAICDTYSTPHLFALVCAGASFAMAPSLAGARSRFAMRAVVLCGLAAASLAALVVLFPQCLGGPYAGLGDYLRQNWFDKINQEKSLFGRPEFVLSPSIGAMSGLFVGALALPVLAMKSRGRNRGLLIVALFSVLAVAHAVLYFRYFRYLPLFSGLGVALVLGAVVPTRSRIAEYLSCRHFGDPTSAVLLAAPGLALTAAIVLFHLAAPQPRSSFAGAEIADECGSHSVGKYDWPAGARVFSPPMVGIRLLSPERDQAVVAIPFHASSRGVERTYRFFDPQTPDPRALLDETMATHVAVCDWPGELPAALTAGYPLTASLMDGRPPTWLLECPQVGGAPLRIYVYRRDGQPEASCPTPAPDDRIRLLRSR